MAYLIVPAVSDQPSYEFQITLESVVYTLAFSYNLRADRWSMDIMDQFRNPLVMGVILLAGVLLNYRFIELGGPPGSFFLFDSQNGDTDPGRDDLGERFVLYYRESTTVDE